MIHRFSEVPEHWDALLQTLEHSGLGLALTFSPNGRLIASRCYNKVILWNAFTGAKVPTFEMTADGDILTFLSDRRIRAPFVDKRALAFSPDSKLLALESDNGTIILRDTIGWQIKQTLQGPADVRCCAFSSNSQLLLSASENGTILVWDTCEWKIQKSMEIPKAFNHMALSANGKLIALTLDEDPSAFEI